VVAALPDWLEICPRRVVSTRCSCENLMRIMSTAEEGNGTTSAIIGHLRINFARKAEHFLEKISFWLRFISS